MRPLDEQGNMGHPTIYPTGVTLYDPAKAWNGYTIFPAADLGALLIDMNGREVQLWNGLQGFPNKLLPDGQVFGSTGRRDPDHGFQDQTDLVQVDWEGNIVWRFSRLESISDPGQEPRWYARQHHDFQREGNPVGYYAPGQTPINYGGKTLLLVHEDVRNPKISDQPLLDDKLIEVSWEGEILWSWRAHEHFSELGFDDAAKEILSRDPGLKKTGGRRRGRLAARQLGIICRSEPAFRRGRSPLSSRQRHLGCEGGEYHRRHRQEDWQYCVASWPQLRWQRGRAQTGLDHRSASCPHNSARFAGRRQFAVVRQWRLGGLRQIQPCFANRTYERQAGLFSCFGNRPDFPPDRVAIYSGRSGFPYTARCFTLL